MPKKHPSFPSRFFISIAKSGFKKHTSPILKLNLFFSFLFLGWTSLSYAAQPSDELITTFLSCGQGDSIVIQTPSHQVHLIDTGPNDTFFNGILDAGENCIKPFLESIQISTLNSILISHPHLDHYGGAFNLIKHFKILEWMDSHPNKPAPLYLELLQKINEQSIPYHPIDTNQTIQYDSKIQIDILNPTPFSNIIPQKEKTNNRSIVLKLSYEKIIFLFPGDIEKDKEIELVKKYGKKIKAQILKSPHHGSHTSNSEFFLKSVEPEIIIVSCGKNNPYHHPHPSIIKQFQKLGIPFYRTDENGHIQITTNGKNYKIKFLKNP